MPRAPLLLLWLTLFAHAQRIDVLVQGAVDSELQPILAALQNREEIQLKAWTFWRGTIAGKRVVVSRTEIGPINAVAATVLGIERFRPAVVVNQGTAGAQNPNLKIWDILVGERTTDYSAFKSTRGDAGSGIRPAERWTPHAHRLRLDGREITHYPYFRGDSALVSHALKQKNPRGRVLAGNIGSAYQFNREIDYLAWANKTFGTDSEDMESAYAHGAATALNTRFVAIRMISDSEWTHPVFERIAGRYCAEFVLEFIRTMPVPTPAAAPSAAAVP